MDDWIDSMYLYRTGHYHNTPYYPLPTSAELHPPNHTVIELCLDRLKCFIFSFPPLRARRLEPSHLLVAVDFWIIFWRFESLQAPPSINPSKRSSLPATDGFQTRLESLP